MDLNISTTVSLGEESKKRWQTVYISQLYGTFFIVYALFNFDREKSCLKSVSLRLINYKGPINLGIKTAKYLPQRKKVLIIENEDGMPIEKIINTVSIKLEVQALNPVVQKDVEVTCILNNTGTDYYFEIARHLVPMEEGEHLVNGVFDSEYYYRDGLREPALLDRDFPDARGLNPTVDSDNVFTDDEGNPLNEDELLGRRGSGGICPRGYSKLMF